MDMHTRPKPAPPQKVSEEARVSVLRTRINRPDQSLPVVEEFAFKSGQTQEMPPIRLKSPDGKRVVEVKDLEKGKSMTAKGWTITDDPKTPYVPPEHLTSRPFQNEGLAALKKEMEKTEKQKPVKRRPYKKSNKEKN